MDMRLTTLDEDGWELDDGEPIAAAHPDTFWIPPREERDALAPGQQVKLIFRILVADEDGSEEVHVERMAPGMPLCFEARHVIHIFREGQDES